MKIYGPYTRKDGRKHILIYDGKSRRTVSYPKWLMEQYLGRLLEDWETVDHINRDFTDDSLENLRVLSRSQHTREDNRYVKPIETVCVWCGKSVQRLPSDMRYYSKKGKAGPFCGKSCSGSYGAEIQNRKIDKLPIQPFPISEYYYLKK
jgi:HNH endonuclease